INAFEQPYRDKGMRVAYVKFADDLRAILDMPDRDRSPFERQLGYLAYRQILYEHEQVPTQIKGPAKTQWDGLQESLKRFDSLRPASPQRVLTATDVGPVSPPTCIPDDRQ